MLKYLAPALAVILAAVAALSDVIQPFIAAHPTAAVILAAVAAIVAALSPQPQKP